jgi:hypothetical protein
MYDTTLITRQHGIDERKDTAMNGAE